VTSHMKSPRREQASSPSEVLGDLGAGAAEDGASNADRATFTRHRTVMPDLSGTVTKHIHAVQASV
jgi:hypothetical protein